MDAVETIFEASGTNKKVRIVFADGKTEPHCTVICASGDQFLIEPSEEFYKLLDWTDDDDEAEPLMCEWSEIVSAEIVN